MAGERGAVPWLLLFICLAAFSSAHPTAGSAPRLHWDHVVRRLERHKASVAAAAPMPSPKESAPAPAPAASSSRVLHVIDYGADPTGNYDSTAAIKAAIADAFRASSTRSLMPGIDDLGGVEVHLDGGTYLISSPLTLPSTGGGNLKIHSGSLRASADFPTNRYLIELWASGPQPASTQHAISTSLSSVATGGYDYEYITLRDLMLDANFCGGGLAVVNSLRTTIDNCYIVHFTSNGIWVSSGHESYIANSYLGQHITAGGDPDEKNFSGTGINLMGNDNAITNVVIFSAAVGIMVSGQANSLFGVHCYNKATGWGGVGIYLKLPGLTQTRIINCYLDYTGIVSEDPNQLHISGSFFLGSAGVVLKSVKGLMKAVDIVDNMFSGSGADIVRLDESGGPPFTQVDQVYVHRNVVDGMRVRSTAAMGSVAGNGTTWAVDFSPVLLLPNRIGNVQYSMSIAGSTFVSTVMRNMSDNRVVIESNVAVSATVYVTVDQNGSMV